MIKRPILTIMLAALTFVATMTASVMNDDNMKASILDDVVNLFESDAEPLKGSIFTPLLRLDPGDLTFETMDLILDDHVVLGKYGEWTYCQYEAPEEVEYGVEFVSATVDEEIEGGGVFLVDFELKNTGMFVFLVKMQVVKTFIL